MSTDRSYNFKKISENVTTSGRMSKNILRSLASENYEAVINLLPQNHKQAVSGEKEIVELQGLSYVYITVEFEDPNKEDLEQFITELKKRGGKKVHIHCAANWRVSAFYAIYALRNGLWSQEEAHTFIFSIWNPDEYPVWSKFLSHFGFSISKR